MLINGGQTNMFLLNKINSKTLNQSENDMNYMKIFSDAYSECQEKIKNEENVLIKQKYMNRLALGIVNI